MFFHCRLNKKGAFFRIETGGQPVDQHVQGIILDAFCRTVFAGDCVPVSHEIKTVVLAAFLQFHPVAQRAVQISQMQKPGGSHPAENSFLNQNKNSLLQLNKCTRASDCQMNNAEALVFIIN